MTNLMRYNRSFLFLQIFIRIKYNFFKFSSDGFIVTEEDLESVTNGLMAELFPMLEALNSIDTRIKGLKTSNYPLN